MTLDEKLRMLLDNFGARIQVELDSESCLVIKPFNITLSRPTVDWVFDGLASTFEKSIDELIGTLITQVVVLDDREEMDEHE